MRSSWDMFDFVEKTTVVLYMKFFDTFAKLKSEKVLSLKARAGCEYLNGFDCSVFP